MQKSYTIRLKPDAKPSLLKTPRLVLLPLLHNVKKELQHMDQIGVFSCVEEAVEWCTGMVVVMETLVYVLTSHRKNTFYYQ